MKKINAKLLEIEKEIVGEVARGESTTRENLQITQHKSVRWAERTPNWSILCFTICRFFLYEVSIAKHS